MTRRLTGLALAALLIGLTNPATALAQRKDVTVFFPEFDGPKGLAGNVQTILELQVWQTLRKAPTPNPQDISFGNGLVTWDTLPLPALSHDAAARAGKAAAADMTVWGQVSPYGDGVVVQAYLTLDNVRPGPLWDVKVPGTPGAQTIGIALPRLRYEFRPLVLDRAIVQQYGAPGALKLYPSRTATTPRGVVGDFFTALRFESGAAEVQVGADTGWVKLPMLSANRSEIVDFVGGIVRALRTDWSGADALLTRVIENPRTPTTLRADALIYRGVARERSGRDGSADFRRAYDANPYDRAAAAYLILSQVGTAYKTGQLSPSQAAAARRLVASNRYLFPAGDAWLKRCEDAVAAAP